MSEMIKYGKMVYASGSVWRSEKLTFITCASFNEKDDRATLIAIYPAIRDQFLPTGEKIHLRMITVCVQDDGYIPLQRMSCRVKPL